MRKTQHVQTKEITGFAIYNKDILNLILKNFHHT